MAFDVKFAGEFSLRRPGFFCNAKKVFVSYTV